MSGLVIQEGEWVVVCDGAKALILENAGDAKFPNLKTRNVYEHDSAATRELGTDKPGRSHSSVGHGRSAVSQTDWHEQAEQAFLTELTKKLDAAVTSHQVKSLILVAPPRALGMIRPHYTPAQPHQTTLEMMDRPVRTNRFRVCGKMQGYSSW